MPNEINYFMEQKDAPVSYITVVRLGFEANENSIEFPLSDAEIYKETDIEKFLKDLVSSSPPNPWAIKKPDVNRKSPLGIPIHDVTHVIVMLDPKKDWQFRDGKPAITAKADYGDQNYGSWHVDDAGNKLTDFPVKCKIAYFSALRRPPKGQPNDVQSFNFHVEFLQRNGMWAEVAIDPDVPETGTEGFPSPILPPGAQLWAPFHKNSIVIAI